jgi:hypothetical protein
VTACQPCGSPGSLIGETLAMTGFTWHLLSPPFACFGPDANRSPPNPHDGLVWSRFAPMNRPCPTPEPGVYQERPGAQTMALFQLAQQEKKMYD